MKLVNQVDMLLKLINQKLRHESVIYVKQSWQDMRNLRRCVSSNDALKRYIL